MKDKIDSRTFLRRAVLVVSPLGIASTLIFKFILNDAAYIAFAIDNLVMIYAAFFLSALYATFVKPSR